MLRIFWPALTVTIVILAGAFWVGGWEVFLIVAILGILEISLSFDNAVVNATVLERMSLWWQKLFLTVGILIAVFGMRLVFPILVVMATAGLGPIETIDLALNDQALYEARMLEAQPAIAAFGGIFLLMIFLDFMFEEREHVWIRWIERPFVKVGGVEAVSITIAVATLVACAVWLAPQSSATVMIAGSLGLIAYLLLQGLEGFLAVPNVTQAVGVQAFILFMYLEVLDASFSFDGVIGAFAITSNIFIIAAGLGIGAMYVRSTTVFLVRRGTLKEFVYLEHGAHYAIGALAILLLVSMRFHAPEIVTGLVGIGFIAAALGSSILRNRRLADKEPAQDAGVPN